MIVKEREHVQTEMDVFLELIYCPSLIHPEKLVCNCEDV